MIEGSRSGSRAGSGSIPLTSGSGSGTGRPKNMWIRIRIRNTEQEAALTAAGSQFTNTVIHQVMWQPVYVNPGSSITSSRRQGLKQYQTYEQGDSSGNMTTCTRGQEAGRRQHYQQQEAGAKAIPDLRTGWLIGYHNVTTCTWGQEAGRRQHHQQQAAGALAIMCFIICTDPDPSKSRKNFIFTVLWLFIT